MAQPISRQAGKRFERVERPSPRPHHRSLTESTPVLFRMPTIAPSELLTGAIAIDHSNAANWSGESESSKPSSNTTSSYAAVATSSSLTDSSSQQAIKPSSQVQEKPATQTNIYLMKRSWWEHWSSGIVLIILVIALVTASIIAFSDSVASDPELLAGQDKDSAGEFGSLPDLEVPNIDLSAATTATPSEMNGSESKMEENAVATTETPNDSVEQQSGLVPDDLTLTANNSSSASAALQTPHGVVATPSSANLETPIGLTPPSLELDDSRMSNNVALAPQSNAMTAAKPPTESTAGVTTEQLPLPMLDTNAPSYEAILTSNLGQVRGQLASTEIQPTGGDMAAANQTSDVTSGTSTVAGLTGAVPQPRATLTPDSDAELYIQAYRAMSSIHKAENSTLNRYPPTTKP